MPYSLCLWLIVVSGPAWSWAWIGNRAWGDLFVSPQEPSNERPVGLGPGLPAGRHRRPLLQHGVSMVARLFRRGWFWEPAGKLMSYGANIPNVYRQAGVGLHLAVARKGVLRILGELLHPIAHLRRVNVQVQRCLCSLPQDEHWVGIFCKPQATQRILPAVRAEAAAHAERPGRLHSLMRSSASPRCCCWPLGAAIGTLGRDKVLVRVEHQFPG